MAQSIYAAFADAAHAESATGALLDHGVPASDISLVVNEDVKKRIEGRKDDPAPGSQSPIVSGTAGGNAPFDPLGNAGRSGSGTPAIPISEMAGSDDGKIDPDLNPVQNDYPRSGSDSTTELSSRPPNSKYDWNPGLDKKSYNDDYERSTSEAGDDEIRKEGDRDRARVDPASVNKENDEGLVADGGIAATSGTPRFAGGEAYDAERAAKSGVTTTTIQDAAKGAAKGVGYGIGVGALAAVASIAIPGFGLVIGGGALAAAVAGLAATAGAGAVAGGVVGYLKDQGVPTDQIPTYQTAYEGGGAIVGVSIDGTTDSAKVSEILTKYGASNVRPFGEAA